MRGRRAQNDIKRANLGKFEIGKARAVAPPQQNAGVIFQNQLALVARPILNKEIADPKNVAGPKSQNKILTIPNIGGNVARVEGKLDDACSIQNNDALCPFQVQDTGSFIHPTHNSYSHY